MQHAQQEAELSYLKTLNELNQVDLNSMEGLTDIIGEINGNTGRIQTDLMKSVRSLKSLKSMGSIGSPNPGIAIGEVEQAEKQNKHFLPPLSGKKFRGHVTLKNSNSSSTKALD